MRRTVVMLWTLSALALAAGAWSSAASAKPAVLVLTHTSNETTTVVHPGAEMTFAAGGLNVITNLGTVKCSGDGALIGSDISDEEPTDRFTITESFHNGYLHGEFPCQEGLPTLGKPFLGFNTSHAAGGIIGEIWMTSKGKEKFYFRSGALFEMFFSTTHEPCVYQPKTLSGTVSNINQATALKLGFKSTAMKIDKEDSGIGCPKKASLAFEPLIALLKNDATELRGVTR
jgi:hypothetical protein